MRAPRAASADLTPIRRPYKPAGADRFGRVRAVSTGGVLSVRTPPAAHEASSRSAALTMPKRSLTAGKGHTLRPVGFDVAADAYSRFMGRYSIPLAPRFADFAGIASGQSVLDVGCGPGALTAELVTRVGASSVSAVDPSSPFVEAVRERHRGVRVQRGRGRALPFAEGQFDAALAQLVVHFMADPVAGGLAA